jgi:hypothetical protein
MCRFKIGFRLIYNGESKKIKGITQKRIFEVINKLFIQFTKMGINL